MWIAISVFVLVVIVKKCLKTVLSLYTILQILSLTLFERMPFSEALAGHPTEQDNAISEKQLCLWDY
jgi:hypothetical protein